jgi:organic hydroperoxide reductase OsmC/OhrA
MSEHLAAIRWQRSSPDFSYESYSREHEWVFPGGITIAASAAPEFRGSAVLVNPEEAFVASVSACHMLSFLALCARKRITVDDYSDQAMGFLEKNPTGKLSITRVELNPRCRFADPDPEHDLLAKLHRQAHAECFIANSVNTKIEVRL